MPRSRPFVLSIAGNDPSAGAGLIADIKTIEANKAYGLAVSTCITYQTENKFEGVDWLNTGQILRQIQILLSQYKINTVKIGIVEDFQQLLAIVEVLNDYNPKIKIIWDPVLAASAGYEFHNSVNQALFEKICSLLYLITPNWEEIKRLYPDKEPLEAGKHLQNYCSVYLKGGHNAQDIGLDHLFYHNSSKIQHFRAKSISNYPKHGSGCVFSSALAANLANGFPLHKACLKAKGYTSNFLNSNVYMLGWHKI